MSEKLREPAAELKNSQPAAELSRKIFIKEVMKMTGGENILECIQCGSCAGGCPTRFVMDLFADADNKNDKSRNEKRGLIQHNYLVLFNLPYLCHSMPKRHQLLFIDDVS